MKAHRDPQWSFELAGIGLVQAFNSLRNAERSINRLTRSLLGRGGEPEQSERAVADELVEVPSGLLDGVPDHLEVAVQDKYRVERKPPFRQARKLAKIAKKDSDLALLRHRG